MPVHRKKKETTPNTPGSTQEQTAAALPDQKAFHQHLRELTHRRSRTPASFCYGFLVGIL